MVQIDTVFQTLYSVYVQINPREVLSEGGIVSVRAEVRRASSPACVETATPTSTVAQVFSARGKIGQALGAFARPRLPPWRRGVIVRPSCWPHPLL